MTPRDSLPFCLYRVGDIIEIIDVDEPMFGQRGIILSVNKCSLFPFTIRFQRQGGLKRFYFEEYSDFEIKLISPSIRVRIGIV